MGTVLRTGPTRFLNLEFEIEGDKQVSAALEYIGEELDDFTEPLEKSGTLLKKTFESTFNSNGGEIGESWAPLSPKYAAWKSRMYPGTGILVRTGRMKGAFQKQTTKLSTVISNAASYFKYHQSNKARKRLPRRVMMKIDSARATEIFRFFTEYLQKVASHFKKT